MKKVTLETIRTILTACANSDELPFEVGTELGEVLSELDAELTKGQARKDATTTAYAEMWEVVRQALADATAPVTAQEIADETGLARGKIVYGLTHSWADEVVKDTSGKSTTYALKA